MIRTGLVLTSAVVILGFAFPRSAETKVVYVDRNATGSGTGDSWANAFATITAGLTASASGDQVWVKSATYEETISMVEGVEIYGGFPASASPEWQDRDWETNETIIDGSGFYASVVTGEDHAVLDGFTVTGGAAYWGGGVYCNDSSPILRNCAIAGNTAGYRGGGIYCSRASPRLTNCTITGGWAESGGGVYCYHASPELTNCTIAANSADSGGGIYCWDSAPSLVNCTIAENSADYGCVVYSSSSSPMLTNCILWNVGPEIAGEPSNATVTYSSIQGGWPGKGNIESRPRFVNPEEGDYSLEDGSCCIDSATDVGLPFNGAAPDMGAHEAPGTYAPDPNCPKLAPAVFYVRWDAEYGGDGHSWATAFRSIGAALGVASASDEIWVRGGHYPESIWMERGVEIYGGFAGTESAREDRDWVAHETVIDAGGLGTSAVKGTDFGVLDGFTITGGSAQNGGGVSCSRASPTLTNCTITGNWASYDGGGVSCHSSSPTIRNCTITGNSASWDAGGVYCSDSSPALTSCTIAANSANYGGGVYCWGSSPSLVNCTIAESSANYGGGVYCRGSAPSLVNCTIAENSATWDVGGVFCSSSTATLTNCTIAGNSAGRYGGGIYCSSSSPMLTNCILWNVGPEIAGEPCNATVTYSCIQGSWPGEGNIDSLPRFLNPAGGDYSLEDGSCCIDSGTDVGIPFNGIAPDMGAYETSGTYGPDPGCSNPAPGVLYVRSDAEVGGDGHSWSTAFQTISAALRVASASDEIWVQGGRYPESVYMERGVEIYGGFGGTESSREERDWVVHETVIDATGLGTSAVNGADLGILDGFTITGGSARRGGGIRCHRASPGLTNCTIVGNFASAYGGGVYCYLASPALRNCTITGNSATDDGGAVYCWESSPILKSCTIMENSAKRGGGVFCSYSSLTLTNCTFSGNSASTGGGVYYSHSSSALKNCSIAGNSASQWGGGILCGSSSPTLTNCIIAGNSASRYSGGIHCYSSFPRLANCTITGNSTSTYGGGIYCHSSSPTLTNCILWNRGPEIAGDPANATVTYTCTQEGWPGEGNIKSWPRFIDSEEGNYSLENGSCCIDSGTDVGIAFNGVAPDMGAYETQGTFTPDPECSSPAPAVLYVRWHAQFGGDGHSWATAFRTISAALEVASTSDEIWVQGGHYPESVYMERGVGIYGGFAGSESSREERDWMVNETEIDATGLAIPAVRGADAANLDGFTITGGSAERGGGIFCDYSSPALTNCVIRENSASTSGGGVYCSHSAPLLTNCAIAQNAASKGGGGIYCDSSSPTLMDCTITGNSTDYQGGGVLIYDLSPYGLSSYATLTNCTITGNSGDLGGGVYCDHSSPTLTLCTIAGNSAYYSGGGILCESSFATLTSCTIAENSALSSRGGGMECTACYFEDSPTLTNCTIARNSAGESGGGISCDFCSPTLSNCTIVGNSASQTGGGIYCDYSSPDFTNCILWNDGVEFAGTGWTCTYSCVEDGAEGEGNILDDPAFVHPWDGVYGDFHLLEASPCIDAGTPDAAYNDACLPPGLGTVRNDMGAYGGPGNCQGPPDIPTPTPTMTPTAAATPAVTPTPTPDWRDYDLDASGVVDTGDLLKLIADWHTEKDSPCDFNEDGTVNNRDLVEFQRFWHQP